MDKKLLIINGEIYHNDYIKIQFKNLKRFIKNLPIILKEDFEVFNVSVEYAHNKVYKIVINREHTYSITFYPFDEKSIEIELRIDSDFNIMFECEDKEIKDIIKNRFLPRYVVNYDDKNFVFE